MVLVIRTSLLCFIVIGLLFAILATSTDFWVKLSVATLELNGALWKICVKGKKNFTSVVAQRCYSISEYEKFNPVFGIQSGICL